MKLRRDPREARAVSDPPTPLEIVKAAVADYERARANRDRAILMAKVSRATSLRELATAAKLSVSRVKQISVVPLAGEASLPPVSELDLEVKPASPDADEHDRVFALATVDPWLHQWPTERDFLHEDPRRLESNRSDMAFEVYDLDLRQRWLVVYIHATREVYAFAARRPDRNVVVGRRATPPKVEDATKGSGAGPCILLGHAFSLKYLDAGLGVGIYNVLHRPGGLAWVYGRLRLLNRLLGTAASGAVGINADPTLVWDYLESLPLHERK